MLVFAVACGAPHPVVEGIANAVERYAASVPNLAAGAVTTRSSASGATVIAIASHSAEIARPRRYVAHDDDAMSVFDGMPVLPDGSLLLDAHQLAGVDELAGTGCGLRVDFAQDRLVLITPALGTSPVYRAEPAGGGQVISNSVSVLRWLCRLSDPDPLGLSAFLTLGWAPADRTLTAGVTALPPGSSIRIDGRGIDVRSTLGSTEIEQALSRAASPDVAVLARQLVSSVESLTAFGTDIRCALTAGRDSRLCLALLRAAGVPATYYTVGAPGEPDVDVAAALASRFGLTHEVVAASALLEAGPALAESFVLQNEGLRSFEQIADQTSEVAVVDSLTVKVNGAGGELARMHGAAMNALARNLRPLSGLVGFQRRLLQAKPDASEGFAQPRASALTGEYIASFVARRVADGWPADRTCDSFMIQERVQRFAGTAIRQAAPTSDLYSPFYLRPFVDAALTGSAGRQFAESLHYELLTTLDPDVRDFSFAVPWPRQSERLTGPRAIALAAATATKRVRQRGVSRGALRRTASATAGDWVLAGADRHLPVVERARRSSLGAFIDLDQLQRALVDRSRLGPGGLRALTAAWWFDTGRGGVFEM